MGRRRRQIHPSPDTPAARAGNGGPPLRPKHAVTRLRSLPWAMMATMATAAGKTTVPLAGAVNRWT